MSEHFVWDATCQSTLFWDATCQRTLFRVNIFIQSTLFWVATCQSTLFWDAICQSTLFWDATCQSTLFWDATCQSFVVYAPTWWAIFRLATKVLVAGVRLPNAVSPTLRTRSTSSRNLSGTSPVQSWFFLLEVRGSEVVASPVGEAQVLRKTAS